MNEWKIEIIVASNQEQYLEECIRYIQALKVPEGYELSFTNISEAVSMAAAYNEAMHSSDAKYKIYIHQDTFLIYSDLLCDLIEMFKEKPDIGMAGVLGERELDKDGIAWNTWNCGRTRAWNTAAELEVNFQTEAQETVIVDAIDGMFMATQYDIEWREDIITGWDFYDLSQSCEFRRKGYQVAVPYQKEAWCLHDCGHSKLQNYDEARRCFCEAYRDFGYVYQKPEMMDSLQERYALIQSILDLIKRLIAQKEYGAVEMMIMKANDLQIRMTDLSVMQHIFEIRKRETAQKLDCFCNDCADYEALLLKYTEIKFYLRRIEYDLEEAGVVLKEYVRSDRISLQGLDYMIEHCVYDQAKVRNTLGKIGE
ncbi:MAG: glycosyltransferase family protein [Lachnospiraceae bacterium]|nr:glycosyltransferase family protein [Lachnospiraceae bacterium]